jgi:L-seryl-tRNA(Ser) seleniumtransferase
MNLRDIPSVDELLNRPSLAALVAEAGRPYVAERIREVLEEARRQLRSGDRPPGLSGAEGASADDPLADLEQRIARRIQEGLAPSLRAVINATGVILHTNLGRAPLSAEAAERVREAAASYTNLEYDLEAGRRGRRDVHAARLLGQLLGAPAMVVNNNAAAVLLALNTLAEGGEVVVSRGELIEIGGSFRIPEIMRKSGATLREVGATNRTRIADYEAAIGPNTRLLLRVHPSNYRIVGFTERPELAQMVAVARRAAVPLLEDLGSGCMFDLRPLGIADEPQARLSLEAGVDLVCFSGDKLLGGPQAGILAGRQDLVEKLRRNPLFRALRVDKMTYAALEPTLAAYLRGRLDDLPVARMIRMPPEEIESRARAFAAQWHSLPGCAGGARLHVELAPGESVIGGGSTPGQALKTTLLALRHASLTAAQLEERLRAATPPVIARVEADRVLLDLRTVFPSQEAALLSILESLAQ